MSRKWNLFSRKKGAKTDSHGTTLANEEIQFRPAIRQGQETQWRVNSLSTTNRNSYASEAPHARGAAAGNNVGNLASQINSRAQSHNNGANNTAPPPVETSGEGHPNYENGEVPHSRNADSSHANISSKTTTDSDRNAFEPHPLVPVANISRTSPRVAKKLIKPGAVNAPQPSFLSQAGNANPGVSISDEYTDPFDAVMANKAKVNSHSTADGYVEPYEAQQMYHDATQTSIEGGDGGEHSSRKLYDDPWDKAEQPPGEHPDYEEPWDNNATLPYPAKRPQNLPMNFKSKNPGDRHGELVLEYPATGGSHSGDSSTSSSSASLAKNRMVRVDSPRHSPNDSPRGSPKLDRRLIRPKETNPPSSSNIDPRLQLYSVPGGGPKYKPVDHRLIKAEPSLGELRRSSPSGAGSSRGSSATNSPMGSNRGSPNQSPISTLVAGEAMDHLTNDPLRRASSPLVQPMNVSHYLLSKAKSRSLDIRNRQCLPNVRGKTGGFIPKSASDDQLTHVAGLNAPPYRGSQPLGGVTEYEEPWDTGSSQQGPIKKPNAVPNIAHSRSRSYELNYNSANMYARHGKSHSFDKPDSRSRPMEYERPWDQNEIFPHTHLESMQRFQHRQLELHPSEAISHRDFDPLLPLERQSWFHGSITRDEANRRLDREIEGSYLVRNSESVRHNFSLSLRTNIETIHMVISRTRDGFWILGEFSAPFHSIPEMVAFYASHRLKINDVQHISLRYPVPEEYL